MLIPDKFHSIFGFINTWKPSHKYIILHYLSVWSVGWFSYHVGCIVNGLSQSWTQCLIPALGTVSYLSLEHNGLSHSCTQLLIPVMYTVACPSLEHNGWSESWTQLLIPVLNTMAYPTHEYSCLSQSWTQWLILVLGTVAYFSLGHYSLSDTIIIYTMFHPREEGEARRERKSICVKKGVEERQGRERKRCVTKSSYHNSKVQYFILK